MKVIVISETERDIFEEKVENTTKGLDKEKVHIHYSFSVGDNNMKYYSTLIEIDN